jgi:penicillin-binding protein 1C
MLRNDTPIPPGHSPAAWLIADMLSDNSARSTAFGFYSALRFGFRVACKTGTSTSFRDNWCFAYTPEFTVGVWAGNFDGQPMREVSGVTGAAPVAHEVMEYLHKFYGTSWYEPAPGLARFKIDPVLGRATDQGESLWEWFPAHSPPEAGRPEDVDAQGRPVLGSEYTDWLRTLPAPARYACSEQTATRILAPRPGTVVLIDPDLLSSRFIPLKAICPRELHWSSETLRIERYNGRLVAIGEPGKHRLRADDGSAGPALETWIEVRQK